MSQKDLDLARLDRLAWLLDSRFRIPFTQIRIGVDGLVGLVPLYGDAISFLISLGVIFYVAKMGVPRALLLRLCINSILDFIIGIIPFFGDVADIFMKSNLRNVAIARKYFEHPQREHRRTRVYIFGVIFAFAILFISSIAFVFWLGLKIFNLVQTLA